MTVITHNLQQLDVLNTIVQLVKPEHYSQELNWPGTPSVGKHTRHVLGHYQQLRLAFENKQLDYRSRVRDEDIETQPARAIQWIEGIRSWLQSLHRADIECTIQYQFSEGKTFTSLHRELDFVASHCVHHLALIHSILEKWDYKWPENAGVHSSTVEYQKQCAL
ncbi:DinB family protein [Aliidiomarina sp.]|uniref:DinB family protein n=1 Tax=Aliidiomarina sp. TaxID=1872439 RepID=UPI003A4D7FCB